jgi:BirA family transcriptional regulator, biotin operon repressor / biotin---[acetyl-CoA-carboxylase] ligase
VQTRRQQQAASFLAMELRPEAVVPLLGGRFGHPYRYEEHCESTQLLVPADAPEGAVATCDFQSSGRGRLGRRWHAPPGTAVQLSVLLRPQHGRRAAELTLLAALAVAEAIEEVAGGRAEIKWPNDVLLGDRKVAGILGEVRGDAAVVGIGVNVNQTEEQLPATAGQPATSLRAATGRRYDRAVVLVALLRRLETRYERWQEHGLAPFRVDLMSRDFLRGRNVRAGDLRGRAVGIGDAGNLVVEAGGKCHTVFGGEVIYEA